MAGDSPAPFLINLLYVVYIPAVTTCNIAEYIRDSRLSSCGFIDCPVGGEASLLAWREILPSSCAPSGTRLLDAFSEGGPSARAFRLLEPPPLDEHKAPSRRHHTYAPASGRAQLTS